MDKVEAKVDTDLMSQIQQSTDVLLQLKWSVEKAQEALDKATKQYTDYAQHTLPDLFRLNGIESLAMSNGSTVSVVTKTSCSINKNDRDKANVAQWLREHDGESLVKSELIVPPSQKEKLQQMQVTFDENTTMNTNSVKAFVISQLGQKGGPATITTEDLPKGLNFYQFDDMEITYKE